MGLEAQPPQPAAPSVPVRKAPGTFEGLLPYVVLGGGLGVLVSHLVGFYIADPVYTHGNFAYQEFLEELITENYMIPISVILAAVFLGMAWKVRSNLIEQTAIATELKAAKELQSREPANQDAPATLAA